MWALTGSTDRVALMLTVGATAGALLSMASNDRIAALGLPSAPERALGSLLGGRDGRLLIIAVCAVVGQPMLALGSVVMTSFLSLGLRDEYLFAEEHQYRLRGIIALVAVLVIGVSLFDLLATGAVSI